MLAAKLILRRRMEVFLFILLIYSGQSFSQEIRVETYLSKSTYAHPELNIIAFNDDGKAKEITIDFGTAAYLENKNSCAFQKFEKNQLRGVVTFWGDDNYSTYENLSTHAVLPPHGFVHRYYPLGLRPYKYPCFIQYKVLDENGAVLKSAAVLVNDEIDYSVSPKKITMKDLDISFIVERNLRESGVLATLKVKNKTPFYVSIRTLEKRLINCDTGFDYGHPIRQGMDGSVINIQPNSDGVALTSLNSSDSSSKSSNCFLQLTIANYGDPEGEEIGKISIPLAVTGEYGANFFSD
jgi:hypothetical protein